MLRPEPRTCPDCDRPLSRRDFMRTAVGGLAAASVLPLVCPVHGPVHAAPTPSSGPETLVAQLYKSLKDDQRKSICFPFNHELRSKVDANWNIVDKTVGDLNPDQQALVADIFKGIHSEQYIGDVMKQIESDNKAEGGLKGCSIALFGEPNKGDNKFEFVLTGRHCTRRCDGNSVAGQAFGGPIFYGHAAQSFNEKPDHPGNVYWFQAKRANEVFQALDGKQRTLALFTDERKERGSETVKLQSDKSKINGIPMTELTRDQKELVHKVMADLLAPFRKEDVDEAMKLIDAAGFDNLHLAFAKNRDIGNDGTWDVWQIESPHMLWYFRGAPHVHTWVHIRQPG